MAPCSLVVVDRRFRGDGHPETFVYYETTRRNVPECSIVIVAAVRTSYLTIYRLSEDATLRAEDTCLLDYKCGQ
jgi:hypothetical protein